MEIYRKTIKVIKSSKTFSAFMNSFLDLQTECEDSKLEKMLAILWRKAKENVANPKAPKKKVALNITENTDFRNVLDYCESCLIAQKPA